MGERLSSGAVSAIVIASIIVFNIILFTLVETFSLYLYSEEKIDFDTALFYLDEAKLDRARHISEMEAPSIVRAMLFAVLILTIGVCIFLLMPEILSWINSIIA